MNLHKILTASFKFLALVAMFVVPPLGATKATETSPLNIIVLEAYPVTKGAQNKADVLLSKLTRQLKRANIHSTKITFYPWNRGLHALKGASNTIILPIDKTKDRDPSLQWVAPLLNVNFVMVTRNQIISSIYDALNFDRILVRKNSNYEYVLTQHGFPNIVSVSSETMHKMLSKNRAEAWFTSDIEAAQHVSTSDNLNVSKTLGIQKLWIAATADVDQKVISILSDLENREGGISTKTLTPNRQLSIASVDNADMKILKELSSVYLESNPNLTINWNLFPENLLRERITTDVLSSEHEYDLVTIGPYELAGWGRKGWLQQFDNIPMSYEETDLFPKLRQSMSLDNKLLALPFYSETLITYYRTDLLADALQTMPKKPSYDDIEKIAAAIHNPSENIYGICLRGLPGWGQNMSIVTSIVKSFGGQWFDNKWQSQVSSPEWYEAINFYIELLRKYGPPHSAELGHIELTEMFTNGNCGIWIDASVFSSVVTDPKRSKIHNKVGIVLAPGQKNDEIHWLWYWALAVPADVQHAEEAKKFALWASSKEYIRLVAEKYGWPMAPPGTRRSTYNEEYMSARSYSSIVKEAMEKEGNYSITLMPSPNTDYQFIDIPEFQLIGAYAGAVVGRMLTGEIKAEQGLAKIHSKSNQIMKQSNYQ